MNEVTISKFMSLVLRHDPKQLGIKLDKEGWTNFAEFSAKMATKFNVTEPQLLELIKTNPKQRLVLRDEKIRANQGHSVEVDLALPPNQPPTILYHGTTHSVLDLINQKGLIRGQRNHVHLSADIETAEKVAVRRSGPWVILKIDSDQMFRNRIQFFLSENGVWLTDHVSSEYFVVIKEWGQQ
jgi:putative RNA 2'-phosphotransferase